jgi:hypothetical protein
VIQAVNGKGAPEIVRKLEQIKDLLRQNCLDIVAYAPAVPVLTFQRGSNSEPLFDLGTDSEHRLDLQKEENRDGVSEEDEAPTLEYLRQIFEMIRAGSTPSKPYVPINKERKQRVKSLSIRQLFLGVYDSPT